MKEHIVILSALVFTLLLGSSFTASESDWGPWSTTSCFRGLDFCVQKKSYNEYARKWEWWVKFRNRYDKRITLDCVLKESSVGSAKGTDRVSIAANSEGGSSWFLVADANSVNMFMNSVRFGNDDWGTPYAQCDN